MAIIETIYTTPNCELLENFHYFRPINGDDSDVETKYFLYVAMLDEMRIKLDVRAKTKHLWFCTSPFKLTIDPVWGGVDAERDRHGYLWLYEYDPKNYFLHLMTTMPYSFLRCEEHAKELTKFYNGQNRDYPYYDQTKLPSIRNYRENHVQLINDGWKQ